MEKQFLSSQNVLNSWIKTPKYLAVKDLLQKEILRLKPGDKILTMREIMANISVSQSTLDRALRELEEENLISRRWGSGIYVNPKGRRRKKTRLVGVCVSDITDRFCTLLIKGIEQALSEENHRIIVCNGYTEFDKELNLIHSLKKNIDGLIINPLTQNVYNPEYGKYFVNLNKSGECPFVIVDIIIPHVNAPFVGFDNRKTFYEVTLRAVRSLNAGRLIFLGPPESLPGAERFSGFKQALQEAQVPKENIKVVYLEPGSPSFSLPREYFAAPKPAVLFVANPHILPKVLRYIHEQQLRIPQEVVVISVVEEDYKDYVMAPIIGLVKPSAELGKEVARILGNLLEKRPVPEVTRLNFRMDIPDILKGERNFRKGESVR
ncbi:MAG: LacI family DNA-binding transcriptional regulator [Candidatus Omnitrophota bacterium]